MPSAEVIRRAPKLVLHDHLDGGLRPTTLVELAQAAGYTGLPSTDPDALAASIRRSVATGSLERYLTAFTHTVAVLQRAAALERVAYECVADHAADGVAYAEVRMAPELCTAEGLTLDAALEAVLAGLDRGSRTHGVSARLIVCGMRERGRTLDAAQAAVRWRERGVVGFDIAGPEAGFPPEAHREAFRVARDGGLGLTVHAGEGAGLSSLRGALLDCGAERIGHGVRITDDIADTQPPTFGDLAGLVHERRVPLEVCPTSNVHIGLAGSVAEHPFGLLHRLGFNVTVNTDNRLMSGVTVSSEVAAVAAAFDLDLAAVEALQVAAADAAFAPVEERHRLIDDVLRPGFAALAPERA